MIRRGIAKIFGIIFVIAAVYFAVISVSNFSQRLNEKDWVITAAEVTDARERKELFNSHYRTVYDIDYTYGVDGKNYIGSIIGTVSYKHVGDVLEIKYNPEAPQECTDVLKPPVDALIFNLVFCCIFAFMGLSVSGMLSSIMSRIRKDGDNRTVQTL